MDKRPRLLTTSVAKKILSAATGLLLCGYLIAHLAGNLLIFAPTNRPFNTWGNFLNGLPFLPLIELALLGLTLMHIYTGLRVYLENKRARPQEYYQRRWTRNSKNLEGPHKSRKSIGSTTMAISGVVTMVLLALHVWHFKYGRPIRLDQNGNTITRNSIARSVNGTRSASLAPQSVAVNGDKVDTMAEAQHEGVGRDLAQLLLEEFKKPGIVLLYVIGLGLLGMHLYHGFASAFQSVGIRGYGRAFMWAGYIFTTVIIGGFILIPVLLYFFGNVNRG